MDLLLRGFTRAQVIERTGTDPGYNGCRYRSQWVGVDRDVYRTRSVGLVAGMTLPVILARYAAGVPAGQIRAELGLGPASRTTPLSVIFSGLGLGPEFSLATTTRRTRRQTTTV